MQNHNILYSIMAALICALFASCATTKVPSRWLPDAKESPSNIYGGWIEVKSRQGQIMGELIAVTKDTLFLADTVLQAIASTDILTARLVTYDASELMGLGVLLVLGTVSTISNGYFLVYTAPMWLIGGSMAVIIRSYDPIIDYPNKPLKQFLPFARYPQGLPHDLDRTKIRMMGAK